MSPARSRAAVNIIGGAVFLFGNALYFASSFNIPISAIADPIGPRFFPQAVAVVGMLLATLLVAQGIIRLFLAGPARDEGDVEASDKGQYSSAFAFLLFGCLFVGLLEYLGYLLTTALVLVLIFKQQGVRTGSAALVAGIGAISMYVLFGLLLGVRLPTGSVVSLVWDRLGG